MKQPGSLLPRPRSGGDRGFTVVELITVLALVGILAAVVLPRLTNPQSWRDRLLADQLVTMARYAQQSALARYGQRVCLLLSREGANPDNWRLEVWAGDDDPALPAGQCVQTIRLRQLVQPVRASSLEFNGTPVGTTPVAIRFDNLGYLTGQSGNLVLDASGRTVCITLGGYAYEATDGASCAAG